jgi:hypothetical protein
MFILNKYMANWKGNSIDMLPPRRRKENFIQHFLDLYI